MLSSLDESLKREGVIDLNNNVEGRIYSFFSQGERRGDSMDRLVSAFLRWLSLSPTIERFYLTITAVRLHGRRCHLHLIENELSIADLNENNKIRIADILQAARFAVQQRSLN